MYDTIRLNTRAAIAALALGAPLACAQHYLSPTPLGSPSPALDEDFGIGLAIDDRYVAVGSFRDDISAGHDGRVYLFDSDTGVYVRTIMGPNIFPNGAFGTSIALEGDLMLVGSRTDQTTHGTAGGGYLYNPNTGALIKHFVTQTGSPGDRIGFSVAMQAPVALLGAPSDNEGGERAGGVYVFLTTLLYEVTKILPDAPIAGEHFGSSVAIDGDYIVVGAPGSRDSGNLTGSVYVFDVNSGLQLHRIVPPGSAPRDTVGTSVDISEGVIAIGAPWNNATAGNAGAVYLYDVASGTLLDTIHQPNPGVFDTFGSSVSLDSGTLVVGASGRSVTGSHTGSIFVYDTGEINELTPVALPDGQGFGSRVAIYQGRIAATGIGSLVGSSDVEGYAALVGRYCDADINADGVVNFFDVSDFTNTGIDYNGDGSFNFFDVSAFISDFNSGCD